MKKYTVVYSEFLGIFGSQRSYATKYEHIETDNLKAELSKERFDGAVFFVFDGWVVETID